MLSDHLLYPSEIFRRYRLFQMPDNTHRFAASMTDICRLTKERIWRCPQFVLLEFADKKQYTTTLVYMVYVSIARNRISRSCRLTLPVKIIGTNCIVFIHCCRRIFFFTLVERDQEYIYLLIWKIQYALPHCTVILVIKCCQKLPLCICAMNIQRTLKAQICG